MLCSLLVSASLSLNPGPLWQEVNAQLRKKLNLEYHPLIHGQIIPRSAVTVLTDSELSEASTRISVKKLLVERRKKKQLVPPMPIHRRRRRWAHERRHLWF